MRFINDALAGDIGDHTEYHIAMACHCHCVCAMVCVYVYSQTSEQRTLWEQYKFKSFVLCREVVLFSEVQNVLEP